MSDDFRGAGVNAGSNKRVLYDILNFHNKYLNTPVQNYRNISKSGNFCLFAPIITWAKFGQKLKFAQNSERNW